MPVKRLTKKFLLSVHPVPNIVDYYDQTVKGFLCRVYPSGRISYYSIFRLGKSKAHKPIYRHIGTFPTIHPHDARNICKSDQIQVALGNNPLDKFKAQTKNNNHFCEYIDRFVAEHVEQKKPETVLFYKKIIKLHVVPYFKDRDITAIKQSDILTIKKKIDHIKTTYNRTHAVLSRFFNWCLQYEIIKHHPLKGIKKYTESRKSDYLSQEQYQTIISSIYTLLNTNKITQSCAACYIFLILTGCRIGEALTLKWAYIDCSNNIIKLPDSKTGAKVLYVGASLKKL